MSEDSTVTEPVRETVKESETITETEMVKATETESVKAAETEPVKETVKETETAAAAPVLRRAGFIAQFRACFVKLVRRFFYEGDWHVIPMAAVIAAIVGFALHENYMTAMEGTMIGTFALVCVCIWNGTYNSIRVVCREREEIRKSFRSGLRISSYMAAHMAYQLVICAVETVLILFVMRLTGMHFSGDGMLTRWFAVDLGLSVLLVTYAADMLALWISSLCRSLVTALVILPFVLVFQVVFSDVLINLPDDAQPLWALTISSPGFNAMASQADLNHKPVLMVSNIIHEVEGVEVSGRITIGQIMDVLTDADNPSISKLRAVKVGNIETIGEILNDLNTQDRFQKLRDRKIIGGLKVGDILTIVDETEELQKYKDTKIGMETTVGEVADFLASNQELQSMRDEGFTIRTKMGDVLGMLGREKIQKLIEEKAGEMNANPAYEHSMENVRNCWLHLLVFAAVFSVLAVISLEVIMRK